MSSTTKIFLIAEYCNANIYKGWHLYLRDNKNRQQRNADGEWGWIRSIHRYWKDMEVKKIFDQLDIKMKGDGTCDDDGIAEFARRFPLGRQRIGGKPRGCLELTIDKEGNLVISTK